MSYFAVKTAHILFVISWLACVFVLPRAILYFRQAQDSNKNIDAIKTLSIKLFRFGLFMFVLTAASGWFLWFEYSMVGAWLHVKLLFVACLLCYFLATGWLLKNTIKKVQDINDFWLRVFNEASLLFVVPILYLAISKSV